MATNNLAYDFDLFDNTKNRKSSAAPKTDAPVKPQAVPKKSRTRSELKKEAGYTRKEAFKIVFVSLLLLAFLGSSVYCRAMVMDLDSQKQEIQVQIKEAESENVRLRSTVDSMYSIVNISAYAEKNLGMIKKDGYQINYYEVK
ncbi:MAG: hypothetical protein IJZ88_05590 [Clostridia bacterium]|nr:hypothetical protein [Clostridia bacterium]